MQLLRSICIEMIKLEKGIEVERDFLATQSDVQLDQVFLMFANSLSDKISAAELTERGRQVGVSCLNDATLLLKRFDSDEDGYLTFWEFANVLLPQDQYRRKQVQQRKQFLGQGTEQNLAALRILISKIVNVEYHCQQMRLQSCNQINKARLKNIFDHLDTNGQGYLTVAEIGTIIYASVPKSDIDYLVSRFNRSKSNGRVTLPEFMIQFTTL